MINPEKPPTFEDVIDELRQRHAAGEVDALAVVAWGPSQQAMTWIGLDALREGDENTLAFGLRLLGVRLDAATAANMEDVPLPGPKGVTT